MRKLFLKSGWTRHAVSLLFTVNCLLLTAFGQAPQKFSYQGVARDNSGLELANQNIGLRITLHSGSPGGSTVYQETHAITTNQFGLFNIAIGSGSVVAGNFIGISWGTNTYYVQVEMDAGGGTSYQDIGTSQLLSVPYALYAETAGSSGPQGPTGVTGPTGANGANGATGATGADGEAGNDGATGPTGNAGATGATGVTGADGTSVAIQGSVTTAANLPTSGNSNGDGYITQDTGHLWVWSGSSWVDAGLIQGPAGATGPTGSNGAAGAAGNNGTDGEDGTTGPTGAAGTNGSNGATGAPGATGAAGTNGATGATGATGAAGANGATGPTGATGTNGSNGAVGATGVTGATGLAGSNGTTGVTGATGSAGSAGATGATGPTGAAGSAGATGTAGATGASGTVGATGATGTSGANGDRYATTSSTSLTIGVGTQSLSVGTGLNYSVGQTVLIANSTSNMMTGTVTSYNSGTGAMTVAVTSVTGSGTFSFWNVNLNGAPGPAGATGVTGATGSAGATGATGATGFLGNGTATGNTTWWDGSQWKLNNNFLYNNGSRIGIATATPSYLVDIYNNTTDFAVRTQSTQQYGSNFKAEGGYYGMQISNTYIGLESTVSHSSMIANSGIFNATTTHASGSATGVIGSGTTSGATSYATGGLLYSYGSGTAQYSYGIQADGSGATNNYGIYATAGVSGGGPASGTGYYYGVYGNVNTAANSWSGYFTGDDFYVEKNVGIGTTTPTAKLHVAGTDGVLATGTFGSGTLPATGAGIRMMWYPRKAAFRAGKAYSTTWDDVNIGDYSVAMGGNATASGYTSFAFGETAVASDWYSVAMGYNASAGGLGSVSLGYNVTATGDGSFVAGTGSSATGDNTTAIGVYPVASGPSSMAFGNSVTSSGTYSTAMGISTTSSGNSSFALGSNTHATGDYSTVAGDNTFAESGYETAFGRWNTDYTPVSTTGWDVTDRLLVIGNGTGSGSRSNAMVVLKNGNTGIGASTPTAKLEVAGQVKITGGAPALNRVLRSDATGLATWVDASTIGAGVTLDGAYDFGGAGAGRTITADAGAVKITGTDGFLVTGTYNSGAAVEISGAGVRMFFNPRKAAFRAGEADGTEWDDANVGYYSVALGDNTKASGSNSTALGVATLSSGIASIAMGSLSDATGWYSTAMGYNTTASGEGSITAGSASNATGNYAIAMGSNTSASGIASTALGYYTSAIGNYCTAIGQATVADGYASVALGKVTSAWSMGETSVGAFNTAYTPSSPTGWAATDRIFVVGNGSGSGSESDAMVILKNGNVGIGNSSPPEKLYVNGNANFIGNVYATGDLIGGSSSGVLNAGGGAMTSTLNYIGDAYVAPAIVSGDEDLYIADDLEVNSVGYKPGGGSWTTTSDARLKKNIEPFNDGLAQVLKIKPVWYSYNDKIPAYDNGKRYVGVLAQEIQKVAPYMVEEKAFFQVIEEDDKGVEHIIKPGEMYYTYDASALDYMLINAVKEQQSVIEKQQQQIDELKKLVETMISK